MCGLFAFSGSKENSWNDLARWKFQMLGVEMDSRGGDGCGIAYDNIISKSEVIEKFDDFWRANHIPKKLEYPSIIGHDRKASVGGKTFNNTQPICFTSTKMPVGSILAHNGTLFNHEELYKKHESEVHYGLDTKGMSDSQMLALLIDKVGWQILNEYIGTVAMLYMNTGEEGSIYAYHGKSSMKKEYVVEVEERSLFYAVDDNEDLWLCSTKSGLEKIVANKKSVLELPFNKVFKITGNVMTEVFSVDRSKCYQNEDYVWPTNRKGVHSKEYNYKDEAEDYWSENRNAWNGGYTKEGNWRSNPKTDQLSFPINVSVSGETSLSMVGAHEYVAPDTWKWIGGVAVVNGIPIHGMKTFSRSGKLFDTKGDWSFATLLTFYFWNGNLVKGRESWMKIVKLYHEDPTAEYKDFTMKIACHFVLPYCIPTFYGGDDDILLEPRTNVKTGLCDIPHYGSIRPIFTTKQIQFRAGKIASNVHTAHYASIDMFENYKEPFPAAYLEWERQYHEELKAISTPEVPIEKPDLYECPCVRNNLHDSNIDICPICNGSKHVTEEFLIDEYIKIEDSGNRMSAISEEAKITIALKQLVDVGISNLEEPDIQSEAHDTYKKLKTIQKMLENGEYCNNL